MRKFLTGSLLVASIGGGVVLSGAMAASAAGITNICGGNPVGASQSGTGGTVQVCTVSESPEQGTVTLSGDASTQQGYVIAQGDNTPGNPVIGYIGVSSVDTAGGTPLVGCYGQQYNTLGGNNQLVDPSNPPPNSCTPS